MQYKQRHWISIANSMNAIDVLDAQVLDYPLFCINNLQLIYLLGANKITIFQTFGFNCKTQ